MTHMTLEEQFGESPVVEYVLYGGKVVLKYNDDDHAYYLDGPEGRITVPNVTSIIGVIDKSNVLVSWAVREAINYLTEKLGLAGEEKHLILPATVEEAEKWLEEARKAHRTLSKAATDIGKMAHNWLERYGKLRVAGADHLAAMYRLPMPENEKAKNCVLAALKWVEEHHVVPHIVERKVYSQTYNAAGTLDWVGLVDGKRSILDFKSSKALYDEYRFQLAAYQSFYTEETGETVEQRILLRLGKEDGAFETRTFSDAEEYEADLQVFQAATVIYHRQEELEAEYRARREAEKDEARAVKAAEKERKAQEKAAEKERKAAARAEARTARAEAKAAKKAAKSKPAEETLSADELARLASS